MPSCGTARCAPTCQREGRHCPDRVVGPMLPQPAAAAAHEQHPRRAAARSSRAMGPLPLLLLELPQRRQRQELLPAAVPKVQVQPQVGGRQGAQQRASAGRLAGQTLRACTCRSLCYCACGLDCTPVVISLSCCSPQSPRHQTHAAYRGLDGVHYSVLLQKTTGKAKSRRARRIPRTRQPGWPSSSGWKVRCVSARSPLGLSTK